MAAEDWIPDRAADWAWCHTQRSGRRLSGMTVYVKCVLLYALKKSWLHIWLNECSVPSGKSRGFDKG